MIRYSQVLVTGKKNNIYVLKFYNKAMKNTFGDLLLKTVRICLVPLMVLLFASCNHQTREKVYKPLILVETKILSDSVVKAIENFKYPAGFLYIIRTVDLADTDCIAAVADKNYRIDKKKKPDGFGIYNRRVYVFVSKNPSLVQLRIEYDVRSGANLKGVTAGNNYLAVQTIARNGDIDKSTLKMIEHAVNTIPTYWGSFTPENTFYERFHITSELSYFVSSKLEMPRLSTNSIYSKYILRSIIQIQIWLNNIWLGYVVFFVLVYLFIMAINAVLFNLVFKNEYSMRTSTKKLIVSNLILIITMIPAINSFAMLTSIRSESIIKLELMQIDGFDHSLLPINYQEFNTAWWLAIIFMAVFYIRLLVKKYYSGSLDTCKAEMTGEKYATFKKANPIKARLLQFRMKAITHDELLDSDKKNVYEVADEYKEYLTYAIVFGIILWWIVPKSVSWVLIFATAASVIVRFVSLLFSRK